MYVALDRNLIRLRFLQQVAIDQSNEKLKAELKAELNAEFKAELKASRIQILHRIDGEVREITHLVTEFATCRQRHWKSQCSTARDPRFNGQAEKSNCFFPLVLLRVDN